MIRRPPRSTRTDTLFPYTTLFRSAPTHGRQNGGFGENLRIGTDRDLEILRPHAVVDQRLLERRGVTAARHHRSDRAADTLLEPPAHLGRLAGVAARAPLDHAFDRRDRERTAERRVGTE